MIRLSADQARPGPSYQVPQARYCCVLVLRTAAYHDEQQPVPAALEEATGAPTRAPWEKSGPAGAVAGLEQMRGSDCLEHFSGPGQESRVDDVTPWKVATSISPDASTVVE